MTPNEIVKGLRATVENFAEEFHLRKDEIHGNPEAEETRDKYPVMTWLFGVREMVYSWSLFAEEDDIISLLDRVLTAPDKSTKDIYLEWLINGTNDMIGSVSEEDFEAAADHLARTISWVNDSAYMHDSVSSLSGTRQFHQETFKDAPWTVFVYLYCTNTERKQ